MSEQIFSVALPEAKVVGVTFANTGRNTENRQSIIHNLYMRGMGRTIIIKPIYEEHPELAQFEFEIE